MNVDTQRKKPIHHQESNAGEAWTLTFSYMVPARDPQGGNGEGGKSAKRGFIMIMIFIRIMMFNKPKEAVSCRDNDHRVTTEQCCSTAVPLSIQVFNLF